MNYRLIWRLLGVIAVMIGGSMVFSLLWAFPAFGQAEHFENRGFVSLLGAMCICVIIGGLMIRLGRKAKDDRLYRKEAIAVVGLGWVMATVLGALPFWFSDVSYHLAGERELLDIVDGLFESASGFSGTGATVLTDLEDPKLVPRSILFWRSETHFLGGLGILVLFVAILEMGSVGKSLMLTEMPGPSHESGHARSQRAARAFAIIYLGLTATLTLLLAIQGMSLYDALCHAFGTIATGGFSTHNNSIQYFQNTGIEMTITLFMVLACTNFTLLYYLVLLKPVKLVKDVEFRAYLGVMFTATVLVIGFGLAKGDFQQLGEAIRYAVFQVASIMTNTGFGTQDFDRWNGFSRSLLLLLMFVGGCAGSTSCSMKMIRHVLFIKILWNRLEKVFHPTVVRSLRVGDKTLDSPELPESILVYFGMILLIFVLGVLTLMAIEPDHTWIADHRSPHDKLVDCASAVAATLNGVGPGLGVVGESENYAHFHTGSKLVLIWMMLAGRLEVFAILVLFVPRFWRNR